MIGGRGKASQGYQEERGRSVHYDRNFEERKYIKKEGLFSEATEEKLSCWSELEWGLFERGG
jgi:hypothetical protein